MRKKCANMWSKTHKEKSQLEKGILRHTSTSLTLPLSTTKNPGYYISNKLQTERYRKPERKVKKKRLKGGEKGDRLKEDKCQIPGFSFWLISKQCWRNWQPEIPSGTSTNSKKPQQKLSLTKGPRKEQPSKKTPFRHNCSLSQPNTTEKNLASPPLTPAKTKWGA